MKLCFECGDCDLRLLLNDNLGECFGAVLESPVEGLQVQFAIRLRNGITDSVPQRIPFNHLRDGSEETDHHDVEHHLLAEIFGDTGGWDAVNTHSCRQLADAHQVLFDDQNALVLDLRSEERVRLLRHHDQDVGPGHVGIEHRRIGKNELCAAGTATRLRPKVLRHGGVAGLLNATCLADDDGRQDNALPSESCDTDLAYWHEHASVST